MRFLSRAACVGLGSLLPWLLPAGAQDSQLIRIIIPFAAGGSSDVMARVLADRLGTALNQTVIVDARPGGSGLVASRSVLAAAADAHTLFLTSPTVMIILPKIMKIDFEPTDVFAPVSNIGGNPFFFAVNTANVKTRTLGEFVEFAKQRPGQLNYASGGTGTSTHLVAEMFFKKAGIQLTHVPFRGGAPAVADLLAGHVDAYFGNPVDFAGQLSEGPVKLLATSGDARAADHPDVPTVAETFPGFRLITWNGLVTRKGSPEPAINRVASAIQTLSKERAYQDQMAKIGFDVIGDSPQAFGNTITRDRELWDEAVRMANIKME